MTIFKRIVIALALFWLYIAFTDGISDPLIVAGVEVAIVYWFYRVFRGIVRRG
jgi:hypothetical protein